jgi:hypothetical protein
MSEQQDKVLQFGSKEISYKLTFQDRKTLGVKVYPDCSVKVIAPDNSTNETIELKLRKKAPWIIKQQTEFLSYHPLTPPKSFVTGETHLYLGQQYRLSIESDFDQKEKGTVKLKNGRIKVYSKDPSPMLRSRYLKKWYRQRAEEWFESLFEVSLDRFKGKNQLPKKPEKLEIQMMSNRWGSCTPGGKIILNPELIKASKASIEYVIVHELCHLIHHNHNRKFFKLQDEVMPDWKKWKERLEMTLK